MFDIEKLTISLKIKDIHTGNWTCFAKPDHICQTFLRLPNK